MVKWGWEKKSIWADTIDGALFCGSDTVIAKAVVNNGKINVEFGEGWEVYLKDKDYTEFPDMIIALEKKLASSSGGPKGTGKGGKSKGGGDSGKRGNAAFGR